MSSVVEGISFKTSTETGPNSGSELVAFVPVKGSRLDDLGQVMAKLIWLKIGTKTSLCKRLVLNICRIGCDADHSTCYPSRPWLSACVDAVPAPPVLPADKSYLSERFSVTSALNG